MRKDGSPLAPDVERMSSAMTRGRRGADARRAAAALRRAVAAAAKLERAHQRELAAVANATAAKRALEHAEAATKAGAIAK